MLDALIEFLKGIPIIARIIEHMIGIFTSHEDGEWSCDTEADIDQLSNAKSSEEKVNAAKNLVSDIRTLR